MKLLPDLSAYPLCSYFLSGYLSKCKEDDLNFPDQPGIFDRYEELLRSALQALGLTKKALRSKPEFNFDSGDAANLESGIAALRVVNALRLENFVNIALLKPPQDARGADIGCERNSQRVCVEVKAITKRSKGRPGCSLENQLYEKILEGLPRARKQLEATANRVQATAKIFACVVNWFAHSICLGQGGFQSIANRLDRDQDCESLQGVEGILFVTAMGLQHLFLNEDGHRLLDQPRPGEDASL
jgi:hypothetical protein